MKLQHEVEKVLDLICTIVRATKTTNANEDEIFKVIYKGLSRTLLAYPLKITLECMAYMVIERVKLQDELTTLKESDTRVKNG